MKRTPLIDLNARIVQAYTTDVENLWVPGIDEMQEGSD